MRSGGYFRVITALRHHHGYRYFMKLLKTLVISAIWLVLSLTTAGLLGVVGAALYFAPGLPDVRQLQDIELQAPLRIFTRDSKLIGEYGEERRQLVSYDEIPQDMIDALLAAEDAGFFKHNGVEPKSLARAALELATSGNIQSGGSTITMQVARNYLLTLDRTFTRKIREILLSLQMEQVLSKQEILSLYVNKIFLGHRAYGIAAASETYYDRPLNELTLSEIAMIAGLPKAPSSFNPLANPERSLIRRNWILYRMRELGFIDQETYAQAVQAPITAQRYHVEPEVEAPYVAEMARRFALDRYRKDAYTAGYRIYTTLDSQLQPMARQALTRGLLDYDTRHGWRGPEETNIPASLVEAQDRTTSSGLEEELAESEVRETARQAAASSQTRVAGIEGDVSNWLRVLERTPVHGPLKPAIVIESAGSQMRVLDQRGEIITLDWSALSWSREYRSPKARGAAPSSAGQIAERGSLVRILKRDDDSWRLSQLPDAEGAIVVSDPDSGAILALQGGFSFSSSKFNRAIQARRQPGSIFKPFIYLAALQIGDMTPATVINDAPVVMADSGGLWRPNNSGGQFRGPTRLRQALTHSRNLVTIRLLRSMGVNSTLDFLTGFGFDQDKLPHSLSLALGAASLTPLEMANGYAILANGGFQVSPWFIARVTQGDENTVIDKATPRLACRSCDEQTEQLEIDGERYPVASRIADPGTVYILRDMLRDVIEHGTGRGALELNRKDIVGKTGSTNDLRDAWFAGFNSDLAVTVWVGKDNNESTGEYGAQAALPIWKDFLKHALEGKPEAMPERPLDVVFARVDPDTGRRLRDNQGGGIQELFLENHLPDYASQRVDRELERETGSQGTGSFEAIF